MALTNPPKNWVVRYHLSGKPATQYNFAGWKESGKPSYTAKFDKIEKFEKADDAFRIAVQLNETGEYVAEVKRICIALEDEYYFI
jgi:hypothetical protein